MITDTLAGGSDNARVPASSTIYADLRRQIVSLELPPDTTLDRAELAARYRISQSPVREAILRLEQEGLVSSFPQSRTVVTRIDQTRISEEHFLRLALESEAVRRLAIGAEGASIVKLRGYLRLQEALVGDLDQADLFKQLDDSFHEALFEGVNQPRLHGYIVSRSGHLARVRTLDLPRKSKMRAVYEGHKRVIDAIVAGDPEVAAAAMRDHLSGTITRIPNLRKARPEYFQSAG